MWFNLLDGDFCVLRRLDKLIFFFLQSTFVINQKRSFENNWKWFRCELTPEAEIVKMIFLGEKSNVKCSWVCWLKLIGDLSIPIDSQKEFCLIFYQKKYVSLKFDKYLYSAKCSIYSLQYWRSEGRANIVNYWKTLLLQQFLFIPFYFKKMKSS